MGIHPAVVAMLSVDSTPGGSVLANLFELNEIGESDDIGTSGETPLEARPP